jgi:hypothetical protein
MILGFLKQKASTQFWTGQSIDPEKATRRPTAGHGLYRTSRAGDISYKYAKTAVRPLKYGESTENTHGKRGWFRKGIGI